MITCEVREKTKGAREKPKIFVCLLDNGVERVSILIYEKKTSRTRDELGREEWTIRIFV